MPQILVTRLLAVLLGATLLYTLYFIWQGWEETAHALMQFPWAWLPAVLAMVTLNFVIREFKWDLFRRWAGVKAPRLGSALTFYAGLSMTISPGRLGELIKPFLLRQFFGARLTRGVPLVLCERVTDLFGMNVLIALAFVPFVVKMRALGGAETAAERFGIGVVTLLLVTEVVFTVAALALFRRRRLVAGLLLWFRVRSVRRVTRPLLRMYLACHELLTLGRLGRATLIGAVSWSFECVAAWLICLGLGLATPESLFSLTSPGVSLWDVTFIFCLASIAGGLLGLPGGLGGFEFVFDQTMKMLLISAAPLSVLWADLSADMAKEAAYGAIGATNVILRASTLFYSVLVGFVFIGLLTRAYHRHIDWAGLEASKRERAGRL